MQPRQRSRWAGRRLAELGTVQHLGDQVDPAARRVHLLAPQLVGRAGGQAETAVDAVRRGRPQLAGGSSAGAAGRCAVRGAWGLPGLRCHQIPPAKRPGAIRCPGSNWSLTARISGSAGTGPHRSTSSRTAGGRVHHDGAGQHRRAVRHRRGGGPGVAVPAGQGLPQGGTNAATAAGCGAGAERHVDHPGRGGTGHRPGRGRRPRAAPSIAARTAGSAAAQNADPDQRAGLPAPCRAVTAGPAAAPPAGRCPATPRPGAEQPAQVRGPLADPGRVSLEQHPHPHRVTAAGPADLHRRGASSLARRGGDRPAAPAAAAAAVHGGVAVAAGSGCSRNTASTISPSVP